MGDFLKKSMICVRHFLDTNDFRSKSMTCARHHDKRHTRKEKCTQKLIGRPCCLTTIENINYDGSDFKKEKRNSLTQLITATVLFSAIFAIFFVLISNAIKNRK